MTLCEVKGDLFDEEVFGLGVQVFYVQAISADYCMGLGSQVEFNKKFNMQEIVYDAAQKDIVPTIWHKSGYCLPLLQDAPVFNLVIKNKYYDKASMQFLKEALAHLRIIINRYTLVTGNDVTKLIMPKIGWDTDRLNWNRVKTAIEDTFRNSPIDIEIRYI